MLSKKRDPKKRNKKRKQERRTIEEMKKGAAEPDLVLLLVKYGILGKCAKIFRHTEESVQ